MCAMLYTIIIVKYSNLTYLLKKTCIQRASWTHQRPLLDVLPWGLSKNLQKVTVVTYSMPRKGGDKEKDFKC